MDRDQKRIAIVLVLIIVVGYGLYHAHKLPNMGGM